MDLIKELLALGSKELAPTKKLKESYESHHPMVLDGAHHMTPKLASMLNLTPDGKVHRVSHDVKAAWHPQGHLSFFPAYGIGIGDHDGQDNDGDVDDIGGSAQASAAPAVDASVS